MSNCNHNCSSCSENCESRSLLAKSNDLSNIKNIIGVVSGKGGVGKSLVTSLLAIAMRRNGYTSAIIDADITGASITKMFGLENEKAKGIDEHTMLPLISKQDIKIVSISMFLEDNTDPVVWRGPVLASCLKQFYTDCAFGDVDYLFVDMPPGTADIPLTAYQSFPLTGIVVVTTPQDLTRGIVEKALKMAKMLNVEVIGIVENMSYFVCPDCNKKHFIYGKSNTDKLLDRYNIDTCSHLPITSTFAKLADEGKIENTDITVLEEIINKLIDLK